jgi:hypothetical protein
VAPPIMLCYYPQVLCPFLALWCSTRSVRKYYSSMHVAGLNFSSGVALYGDGGEHGGPITNRIELPKNWGKLLAKYNHIRLPKLI